MRDQRRNGRASVSLLEACMTISTGVPRGFSLNTTPQYLEEPITMSDYWR